MLVLRLWPPRILVLFGWFWPGVGKSLAYPATPSCGGRDFICSRSQSSCWVMPRLMLPSECWEARVVMLRACFMCWWGGARGAGCSMQIGVVRSKMHPLRPRGRICYPRDATPCCGTSWVPVPAKQPSTLFPVPAIGCLLGAHPQPPAVRRAQRRST